MNELWVINDGVIFLNSDEMALHCSGTKEDILSLQNDVLHDANVLRDLKAYFETYELSEAKKRSYQLLCQYTIRVGAGAKKEFIIQDGKIVGSRTISVWGDSYRGKETSALNIPEQTKKYLIIGAIALGGIGLLWMSNKPKKRSKK